MMPGRKMARRANPMLRRESSFMPITRTISEPAAGCASYRTKKTKLSDSGVMAAMSKATNDAEFKSFQFFFAPAHRSGTDTGTTDGAQGTFDHDRARKVGGALPKISRVSIEEHVAYPRSR